MRLINSGIRIFQKICTCSAKLLQNSHDGTISVLFSVTNFPNGNDSDVGIKSNNPLRNVENKKHNVITPNTAIVSVFTYFSSLQMKQICSLLLPAMDL
jgi:hypothetical protein